MSKPKKTSRQFMMTLEPKTRELLEFVYGCKIQKILYTMASKEAANVSVEKQQDYAKWAQSEANKQ